MKSSDKYLKIVEWSEEDQCYVGTCPGLMLGGIHGDDEAKVYKELCQAVEEWIEVYQEDGEALPAATTGIRLRRFAPKLKADIGPRGSERRWLGVGIGVEKESAWPSGARFGAIGVSPSQYTLQAVSSCAILRAWRDICELSFLERFTTSRAGWWAMRLRWEVTAAQVGPLSNASSETKLTGGGFWSGFASGSSNTTSGYFCSSA